MIATLSALMASPDALYIDYERADAHTTGPRMVRQKPHRPTIDRSRLFRTIRHGRMEVMA